MFCNCMLWSLWGLQKNLRGLRPNYSTTIYFSRAKKWWQVVLITLKYSWKRGGTINCVLLLAITHISQRWEDRSKTLAARSCSCYHLDFFIPQFVNRSELMSAQGIGWRQMIQECDGWETFPSCNRLTFQRDGSLLITLTCITINTQFDC